MLACDKTVTLVKCDGEKYTATTIEGVSWFDKTQVRLENTGQAFGMAFTNATKVRIPARSIPDVLPEVGDILILGKLPPGFTIEKPADLAAYRHVKVMGVGDNRRGSLPHLAVICQ